LFAPEDPDATPRALDRLVSAARSTLFDPVKPTPAYPTNAPCWVAKGPKSIWYTGNSPGDAISIFFTDNQGGTFYKSVPLPGSPTDVSVSPDQKWLAVIYTAGGQANVGVFSIDDHGDLTPAATSPSLGFASFNGVAFSE
jgi:6-phosphogluconolactonase (cycloisomerase 2 family)